MATAHERWMNSRQPSRRSPRIDADAIRTLVLRCIDAISVADAKKVIESMVIAHAGLPAATISAPIAGPAIDSTLYERPRSALASCSRALLTVSLTSPVVAGRENAPDMPNTACRSATFQTLAVPEKRRMAVPTCAAPFTRSVPTRIVRRGRRSAKTPPSRTRTTSGTSRASSTIPRSVAPPNPSTAKAMATIAMLRSWSTSRETGSRTIRV